MTVRSTSFAHSVYTWSLLNVVFSSPSSVAFRAPFRHHIMHQGHYQGLMSNSVNYYYYYIYLGKKEETIVPLNQGTNYSSPYFYLTAAARILMTRDNELRKLIEKNAVRRE